ncbi:MAG TPA: rRNA maturation RNase YbeY, partial [Opitutales bacterium]|nr:rRNA maturation RNase YbeY [Opitutales bacterium]
DFAGEICVSADRAKIVSTERGIDFSHELSLYLIHGWLHLAGYDDLTPQDRKQMRQAEKAVMQAVEAFLPTFKI